MKVTDLLYTNMEAGMKNYNQSSYEGVTHTWDIIQLEVMNKIIQYSARCYDVCVYFNIFAVS